jgi:integrase
MNATEEWLSAHKGKNSFYIYKTGMRCFADFMKKSHDVMLAEHREALKDPLTSDTYAKHLFAFSQHLFSGGLGKTLSQNSVKTYIVAVQSFFAFNNSPIDFKKFLAKDARLRRPQVLKRKHIFNIAEIEALFRISDPKEKAMLALGLMGQDRSTVASMKLEEFVGLLGCRQIEFIDFSRPKSNLPIKIILTPEVQHFISDYIVRLGRHEGWLFDGYQDKHMNPSQLNSLFNELCQKAGLVDDHRAISFHCLRKTFSSRLQTIGISSDLIDGFIGHSVRYGAAYSLLDNDDLLRTQLEAAHIQDALRILPTSMNNHVGERVAELERVVHEYQLQEKVLMDKLREYDPKFFASNHEPSTKPAEVPVRDVKDYTPSKKPKKSLQEQIAELQAKIEALEKSQKK